MTLYSFWEGNKRAILRAVKVGVIASVLTLLNSYVGVIPVEFSPVFAFISGYLEKLERNYREVRKTPAA